jgi:hypothetical protein
MARCRLRQTKLILDLLEEVGGPEAVVVQPVVLAPVQEVDWDPEAVIAETMEAAGAPEEAAQVVVGTVAPPAEVAAEAVVLH